MLPTVIRKKDKRIILVHSSWYEKINRRGMYTYAIKNENNKKANNQFETFCKSFRKEYEEF